MRSSTLGLLFMIFIGGVTGYCLAMAQVYAKKAKEQRLWKRAVEQQRVVVREHREREHRERDDPGKGSRS